MSVRDGNMHYLSATDGENVLSDVAITTPKTTGRRRGKKQ